MARRACRRSLCGGSYLGPHLLYIAACCLLGGVALHLSEGAASRPFLLSLFTATSAVCQTGLIVIDTSLLRPGSQALVVVLMLAGG
jgi:hypothetical protein